MNGAISVTSALIVNKIRPDSLLISLAAIKTGPNCIK